MSHSALGRQAVVEYTCGSPDSSEHGMIQPCGEDVPFSIALACICEHKLTSHVSAPEKVLVIL